MTRLLTALIFASSVIGCAGPVRFKDQPIVWTVDDTRDMKRPAEHEFLPINYFSDIFLFRRLPRALELRDPEPAMSTNALDEVPDSTWFTNRIGVRKVSPAEAAQGATDGRPPQVPLTIVFGKGGGANPGFFAKDALGRTFLVKFDTLDNPQMQTATGVIVNRIFWTLGYHVDANYVLEVDASDFVIGDGAKNKDEMGRKRPFTQTDVDEALATSPRTPEGRYRIFVSQFLPGVPVGGIVPEGVRPDDPNDTIPHERRRELRGLYVFAAWTGHTDMKEDNTLDMWVEEDGRHFVRHYLLDFGEALGAHQAEKHRYEDGWEHFWDWEMQTKALLSFGLWKRAWEAQPETPWLSVGAFGAEHFDPHTWREAYPYWPFFEHDAADDYWAAKQIMRFDRPLLEAIVATGELAHPKAATYLVDTLIARAQKIGHAYLEAVTPFDELEARPGMICGVDLGLRFGLANSGALEVLDTHGAVISRHTAHADGSVCVPLDQQEGYQVLRLRIRRGPVLHPAMEVHARSGLNPRILGIIRVAE